MPAECFWPLAIDLDTIVVKCTACQLAPPIYCSFFGYAPDILLRHGECQCGTTLHIEELLMHMDDRVVRETLAMLGYVVPRSMN